MHYKEETLGGGRNVCGNDCMAINMPDLLIVRFKSWIVECISLIPQ